MNDRDLIRQAKEAAENRSDVWVPSRKNLRRLVALAEQAAVYERYDVWQGLAAENRRLAERAEALRKALAAYRSALLSGERETEHLHALYIHALTREAQESEGRQPECPRCNSDEYEPGSLSYSGCSNCQESEGREG